MKRLITADEVERLKEHFGPLIPDSLLSLLSKQGIIGNDFELSEKVDASGFGVEMRWMAPEEQLEEAFRFYPGIEAIKKKYIPVGICLRGSGDPYFIKEDSSILKIYRIPHESAINGDIDESQIEYVCQLDDLIKN
ncbi:MAG: hypothetical protein QM762_13215 [Chryseolinea sp.]